MRAREDGPRDNGGPDSATNSERGARVLSMRLLGSIAALVLILDQGTKAIVRATLPLHDSVAVVPNFLSFTHVRNTGAAFGLLNAVEFPFKPAIMTLIALAALAAIGLYALKTTTEPAAQISLALVMGGAVGNIIDRVTAGYVVDFVDVYWRGWHFWAFNVADAGITVGASLLILDMIWMNRHVSETS